MKKITFTMMALWVLGFTSLAYATPNNLSGAWELTALNGNEVGISAPITIEFISDQATIDELGLPQGIYIAEGFGGCNPYNTIYNVVGTDGIDFGSIASSIEPFTCDVSDIESSYFSALDATAVWTQDGESLMMQDGSGAELLQFSKADQSTVPLAVSLNDVMAGSGTILFFVIILVIGLSTTTVMKTKWR